MTVGTGDIRDMQNGHASDPLAALFSEHYAALMRIAYAMTGSQEIAEELTQETFVRVARRLDGLRDPQAAPLYLRRTLVNLVRRSFQRRMLELRHRVGRADVEPETDHAGRLTMVGALRTLSPRQRVCVVLRFYEDRTEQDTARLLGVSVGTVKSQTHKALKKLESILKETE
jgi:RNA polymerase sigma-70 factor (sigma-E family)